MAESQIPRDLMWQEGGLGSEVGGVSRASASPSHSRPESGWLSGLVLFSGWSSECCDGDLGQSSLE